MIEWVRSNEALVWSLAGVSVFTFFATLIVVPILVVRIPADYFSTHARHRTRWEDQHPVVRVLMFALKNVLGALFVVAGTAMLALPGQGLLTMVMGLVLLDFPGKYKLERWLVTRRAVHRSIDWLRRRAGREPLLLDGGVDLPACPPNEQ